MTHKKTQLAFRTTIAALVLIALAQSAIAKENSPLDVYAGYYREGEIEPAVRMYVVDGVLYADVMGRDTYALKPVGDHAFGVVKEPGTRLTFAIKDGKPTGYTLEIGGEKHEAERLTEPRNAGDSFSVERTLSLSDDIEVKADYGRFIVPENRSNPDSRLIELAYVRLRSTSENPGPPLIYLAGGPGGSATWMARDGGYLRRYFPFLELGDVVFFDQRGTGKSEPRLRWTPEEMPPMELLVSADKAVEYARKNDKQAYAFLKKKGADLNGYTSAQSADDIRDLAKVLGAEKINIQGFSYGSHLAQSMIRRHPEILENVIICGVEGLHQTYKLPLNADTQFGKIALFARQQPNIAEQVPDLEALLLRVFDKLDSDPIKVNVTMNGRDVELPVGRFGLQMLLRFDIGDRSDLVVFPRLLYSIDTGDPSVVEWFVQKRLGSFGGVNGMSVVMDAASGASPERRALIAAQAEKSKFGNVANLRHMYPGFDDIWHTPDLGEDFRAPLVSDVRTLFLTGTLDWNTPPFQAEMVRWGFSDGTHLIVENAGHEQILPQPAIQDAMLRFLKGEDVSDVKVVLPPINFVPLTGFNASATHPSVEPEWLFERAAVRKGDRAAAVAIAREFMKSRWDQALPLNQFAWALATEEKFGGKYNAEALEMAQRAVELTQAEEWMYLDTLAHVHFAMGDKAKAVETERRAVAAAAGNGREDEAKAALAKFEAAMK